MPHQSSHTSPGPQDDSKILMNETGAITVGIFASIIAVAALGWGVDQFFILIGRMIVVAIAAYTSGLAIHFWISKVYVDGMSNKEILAVGAWPVDLLRVARNKAKFTSAAQSVRQAPHSSGPTVIDEKTAKVAGIAVGALAVILTITGVFLALSSIVILIGLIVVAYYVGAIVQFWVARSWKDGLTVNELKATLTWPIVAMIYAHGQD